VRIAVTNQKASLYLHGIYLLDYKRVMDIATIKGILSGLWCVVDPYTYKTNMQHTVELMGEPS